SEGEDVERGGRRAGREHENPEHERIELVEVAEESDAPSRVDRHPGCLHVGGTVCSTHIRRGRQQPDAERGGERRRHVSPRRQRHEDRRNPPPPPVWTADELAAAPVGRAAPPVPIRRPGAASRAAPPAPPTHEPPARIPDPPPAVADAVLDRITEL